MKDLIIKRFKESADLKTAFAKKNCDKIIEVVHFIAESLKSDNKIMILGNGGSAADAQHIAGEWVGHFQRERKPLPAIALTTDTSALTAIGNDYGFDQIFARQVRALGRKGDVPIGISTSGNSQNVIQAVKVAKKKGLITVSLTGCSGGKLAKLTDINIDIPSKITARIQESHICIAHCICELVEENMSRSKF